MAQGQIERRGERTFRIRWFNGRDAGGRRRYGSKTVHGTKRNAESKLREILHRQELGVVVESRSITLNRYLDQWLETKARSIRARTLRDYRDLLASYVRPTLGEERLDRITPLALQRMLEGLQGQGRPCSAPKAEGEPKRCPPPRPLSARTVRLTHTILSGALRQAVAWRMIGTNPAIFVQLPRQERREMRALGAEEAGRFREAIAGTRFEALFLLLLGTGMRPSEALALRWRDLDLDAGRATVQRSLVCRRPKGGPAFEEPKTGGSRRAVPIPPSVASALRTLRRREAERRLALGLGSGEEALVFATETGAPVSVRNLIARHFKTALRRAELPQSIRLYDLRHSFASLALASGLHPKDVAQRLGHGSTQMTLDIYSHVLEPVQADGTARIEATIFGPAR